FEPVQPQYIKCKRDNALQCIKHCAPACKFFTHPIADGAGLRRTAADVAKRYAAKEIALLLVKKEKRIRITLLIVVLVAPYALPVGLARQFVMGPDRFPWR